MKRKHDTNIIEMVFDDEGAFVVVAGIKVARRGLRAQARTAQAKTAQAKTWVSLEPGWKVFDGDGMNSIVVECNGARLRNCFIVRRDAAFG
jgi:hypothetical protein